MPIRPGVIVEAAFATRPTETPTWMDVTAYVEEIHTRRGRNNELDRVEAGTATLVLRNDAHRFDPDNSAGPYYGNLKPMRRIRVRTADHGIFSGYVERWPLSTQGLAHRLVTVELVDGFGVLAMNSLTASYPEQRTDERIDAILNACSWTVGGAWILGSAVDSILGSTTIVAPVGDRALDQGNTRVQAVTLENQNALQHAQDVAALEMGLLYCTKEGAIRFQNRHARLQNLDPVIRVLDARSMELEPQPDPDSAAYPVWGTGPWPYDDIVVDYDDSRIVNKCRVRRQGQTAWFEYEDANSRLDHFPRPLVRDYVPLSGENDTDADNAAQALARWMVRQYAQPEQRISRLELDLAAVRDLWKFALGPDLGDRVAVVRYTASGPLTRVCYIEGIEHDITDTEWRLTWRLSPAPITTYWRLGDSERSVLGTTTTIAY